MKIRLVFDAAFAPYGKVLTGFDLAGLESAMQSTPCPDGGTIYVASDPELEKLPIFNIMSKQIYGGMPIQIGYCNGDNHVMNCLEYHRDSEINLACDDLILLLGKQGDIDYTSYSYDTANVEAFLVPRGTLVEVYATSLHYAPINAGGKFRCVVVLPRGTNFPLSFRPDPSGEGRLLTATNKWLLPHPDSPEALSGAVPALTGRNHVVNY